jgi:DinB superfamily
MKLILVTLFAVLPFPCARLALGQAQTMSPPAHLPAEQNAPQTSATAKNPVTTALGALLPRARNNILGAITAMPADKFNYKPTPDQMTFAHLVVHTIGSNNALCAKVADIPAPKAEEVKETDAKDKLLAAATASFDFCGEALGKMDDSKLGDAIELFGRQGPRAMAALGLASGWADHYGAAAMYLRLNNILPPSAQPKK